ncbi:MAG: hypothetical protein ACREF7_00945 [Candidatus Saccharimonadales bacterium]
MNSVQFKDIARWIAVLPGSVVCSIAATFPIHWGVLLINYLLSHRGYITYFPLPTLSINVIEFYAYALFVPFIVIAVGAKIAPKYKFKIGVTLAILFGVLIGYGIGTILVPEIHEGLYNMSRWLRLGITVALWAISIAWGIHSAYIQDAQFKREAQKINVCQ